MDIMTTHRDSLLALFRVGVGAADPRAALALSMDNSPAIFSHAGAIHLVAVGKAAIPMMEMARTRFAGKELATCLAVTNYENVPDNPVFRVIDAAHPLPDENGVLAGQEVASLLEGLGPDDLVILLLSGGGSALLPCPAEGITLAEKSATTDLLLRSGADIQEINEVRRALSRLKGGGFAELAHPAKVCTFILSDVPGDVLKDIASGPTVPGSRNRQKAAAVLRQFGLWEKVPAGVRDVLEGADVVPMVDLAPDNILIGSNAISVKAMADSLATEAAEVIPGWLDGDVRNVASRFVDLIEQADETRDVTWLAGGETSVQVTGTGRGGRNQEMALRVAVEAGRRAISRPWVFLSGGTDGRDGPTDAAGGLTDPRTLARMAAAGVDVSAHLDNNDSYAALKASGDLVMTGGTGTNVADLQVLRVLKK